MNQLKGNINNQYEILTQEIYRCLLNAEGFENIEVKHNIKLLGKSGCNHQIDVYWEFILAGETHRVAIECKNYTKEVSIAKVRDFFGVIYDIGNIKGIFVTKKGFQSGAKRFAEYYGIRLKELRKPQIKDWTGRLKTIKVKFEVMPIVITAIIVEPDYAWMISKGFIKSEEERQKIVINTTNKLNTEIYIYDENDNVLNSFFNLEQKLPHNMKSSQDLKHIYEFNNGFMESNFGKIKVNSVGFKYDINTNSSELILEAEELTKAIIKDIKTGEMQFINNDGSIK